MTGPRRLLLSAACAGMLTGIVPAAAEGLALEPYKMVRSLQRMHDEIADGDKSALGMQREMVKLIDEGFRTMEAAAFRDPKNARALISYAMAGGNPKTLESRIADLGQKDDEIVRLAVAVLVYQRGAGRTAASRLQDVDPVGIGGLFGASLALVRGLVTKDDEQARIDFDTARLLAPGTLVEEAALRRLMTIHKRRQDPVSFLRVASRYARRYIASPYAIQFAQEFVNAVVEMDDVMDMTDTIEIIEFMPEPYRGAVTVRLMRKATVEGNTELVRRISELSETETEMADAPEIDPEIGARQVLYARISEVTSENVDKVADELQRIDRSELADSDRNLLDAVIAIARAVTDPEPTVTAAIPSKPVPGGEKIFRESVHEQQDRGLSGFDEFVGGAREKLENIDQMLEEMQ